MSLSSSCLFSCLASSLFLSSLFSSLDLLFSCLVSPLSSSRFFSVSLSLSLSVPVSVWCCVLWCVVCVVVVVVLLLVVVCVCVCVAARWKKTWKKNRVCIQNVPVYAGTTRTCVSTCARGAGTHGDVLNLHTEDVLYIHGGQGVIVSSAYQNLPTYGHHVIQRFTKETSGSSPFSVWE